MILRLVLPACLLAASVALAQESPATPTAADKTAPVAIDRDVCARVTEHRTDANVAYRPGVDVRGNAVAPADLGGGYDLGLPSADELEVQIEIDLADRLGLGAGGQYLGRGEVATVGLDNGRVIVNGNVVAPQDEAALIAACRAALAESDPPQ